jgi:regulator of sigma E protease
MDTEFEGADPEPHEFRAKPVWQRMIVITAGVVFNIILAFVIFAGLKLSYGDDYVPADNIESVYVPDGTFAHEMGLRTGDRIVAVSGRSLERYNDLLDVENLMADPMTVTVVRDGDSLTFRGPDDIMTQLNRAGGFGVSVHPSLIGSVMSGSAAYEAGIRPGDRILAIDGQPVGFWLQITEMMQASGGDSLDVTFARAPDGAIARSACCAAISSRRLLPREGMTDVICSG